MKTLSRTALKAESHLDALPSTFPPFERAGIEIRRGELTMFAAPPASAKTFLALQLLKGMGVPTLYFSADTSMVTQMERAAAMATGHQQRSVRTAMQVGGEDYYADVLAEKFGHIRFVDESDPTYEDLELETAAYAEAYGEYPHVIVVDNLVNLVGEGDGEYASQKESTRVLNRLVRITNCSLWLLHHMNEKKANPNFPSPRTDIANKLAQLPALILSIAADNVNGLMRVAVVKRRTGNQDPSGGTYITFWTDLDTGAFYVSEAAKATGHAI